MRGVYPGAGAAGSRDREKHEGTLQLQIILDSASKEGRVGRVDEGTVFL